MEDPYYVGLCGEEKLFVKILRQALHDLKNKRYAKDAYRFFTNEENDSQFNQICRALLIEPEPIVTKVKNYYNYGKSWNKIPTYANTKIPDQVGIEFDNLEYDAIH